MNLHDYSSLNDSHYKHTVVKHVDFSAFRSITDMILVLFPSLVSEMGGKALNVQRYLRTRMDYCNVISSLYVVFVHDAALHHTHACSYAPYTTCFTSQYSYLSIRDIVMELKTPLRIVLMAHKYLSQQSYDIWLKKMKKNRVSWSDIQTVEFPSLRYDFTHVLCCVVLLTRV